MIGSPHVFVFYLYSYSESKPALHFNFSFNNEHYLQKHGTAMGTRMAPSYANLFMGKFEQQAFDTSLRKQEPITRSLQLPHIPVTAFLQTDLFLV